MRTKDTILSINVVEPALVDAVNKHAREMKRKLKGLMLVHSDYASEPNRPKDTSGLFKEVICNFDDPDDLQQALKPYQGRLLAATCRYESSVQQFRKTVPFLPFIFTPSESALLWATEKLLMRDRLKAYDPALVPKYQSMEAKDLAHLDEIIKDFSFPVIIKPSELAEALLVTQCKTESELKAQLAHTFKVIQQIYKREHRSNKPSILVEEMMQGEMYSTDAYVTHDGKIFCLPLVKVITAHAVGLPGFYSYRHIIPTGLSDDETQTAFSASRSAVKALNLSSTTTHIELIHTTVGWKIIEVAARIGGYREDLYREAFGIGHFYNDLLVRMGMEPQMPTGPLRHAAGVNIYADKEGYIESIKGLKQARELSSVVYIDIHAKPGDRALFANNGGQLIVDGILSNEDPGQLESDVAKLRELVKIKVRQNKYRSELKNTRLYPVLTEA